MSDTIVSLRSVRNSLQAILAFTLEKLFPEVVLLSGQTSQIGFSYDFLLPGPLNKEMLCFLEEEMGREVRTGAAFCSKEMMRTNAIELFSHLKKKGVVKRLKEEEGGLVDVLFIGDTPVLAEGPHCLHAEHLRFFKLLELRSLAEPKGFRIEGTAFLEKKDCKGFLKLYREAVRFDHRLVGERMELFLPRDGESRWLFLPKGEEVRQKILAWWQQIRARRQVQLVDEMTPAVEIFEALGEKCLPLRVTKIKRFFPDWAVNFTGLLEPSAYLQDVGTTFCREGDLGVEVISCLQFIQETLKLSSIKDTWTLYLHGPCKGLKVVEEGLTSCGVTFARQKGTKFELLVTLSDSLGREWRGPSISLQEKGGVWIIEYSTLPPVERWIALLLEKEEGRLPENLAPEPRKRK